ncbi:MAG: S8 family serine peptidase [Phycisphaerales bacterium JB040]
MTLGCVLACAASLLTATGVARAHSQSPAQPVRVLERLPEGPAWSGDDRRALLHTGVRAHDFAPAEARGALSRSGWLLLGARDARGLARLAPMEPGHPGAGVVRVRVPAGVTEEALADARLATGDYAWAQPDWRVRPAVDPNDARYPEQYHHTPGAMNTSGAWNVTRGDPSVVIAVIDSGVDLAHPDLPPMLDGYNAADRLRAADGGDVGPTTGHGTWVTGIIGAAWNNGVGVAGAAPRATLLPIRASNASDGSALTSELVHAATWAADNGARIVSVSYEGVSQAAVGALGDELRARGVLLVWAAGNSGGPFVTQDWPGVTVVGATTRRNRVWGSSNYGDGLDVVAPGEGILTTDLAGAYRALNGTSFATPLVAGVLGLIWSADPALDADEVEAALFSSATDLSLPGWDTTTGWGLVNAGAAVAGVYSGEVLLPVPFAEAMDGDPGDPLDPLAWPVQVGASISTLAPEEVSGNASLRLDPGATVETAPIAGSGGAGLDLRWHASAPGDAATSALGVWYLDQSGVWRTLSRVRGGLEESRFGWHAARLPADALHDGLRLRLQNEAWSSGPVYVDALALETPTGISPPWRAGFDEAAGSAGWSLSGDAAVVSGVPSVSGGGGVRLADAGAITSLPILTLVKWGFGGVTDARLGLWARPVSGTGRLLVEAGGFGGSFGVVGTLEAAQFDTGRMTLWDIPLPGSMLVPGDAPLRIRAEGGVWDVDDVVVRRGAIGAAAACLSDLNLDGVVDAGDVLAFAAMYARAEPGADLDNDGDVDPADASRFVGTYLSEAGGGC